MIEAGLLRFKDDVIDVNFFAGSTRQKTPIRYAAEYRCVAGYHWGT